MHKRDPVSVSFDAAAARLLARASRRPGQWTGTRVGNPSAAWITWGLRNGVPLLGPDDAPGGQARTRWCRGFIRSTYYVRKWYMTGSGQIDIGAIPAAEPMPPRMSFRVGNVDISAQGLVIGRRVSIKLHDGSDADALDAVQRLPDSRRIYSREGDPAGRWADPGQRDWE